MKMPTPNKHNHLSRTNKKRSKIENIFIAYEKIKEKTTLNPIVTLLGKGGLPDTIQKLRSK